MVSARTAAERRELERFARVMEKWWKRAGRINKYGLLRVDGPPAPRWTIERVAHAFPHLAERDMREVVRDLDGILPEEV